VSPGFAPTIIVPVRRSRSRIARNGLFSLTRRSNLRRRSGSSPGPGALAIDPDLPPPSPNQPGPSSPTYSSNDDITLSTPDGLDDGSLFWVPAHLHPELAPGEFRAFLKAHTHADPANADASEAGEAPGLARSPSWLARRESSKLGSGVGVGVGRADSGLGRKRSMLSRQYHPTAGDHVEEEMPPLPRSNRASIYAGRGGDQGLTLHDLQKLEMLVEQAGDSDDPAEMRKLLRRSLSLNVAPGCELHLVILHTPLIRRSPARRCSSRR
jgi:hypothetical protein